MSAFGVKQTLLQLTSMSAFDPKRTFAVRDYRATHAGYLRPPFGAGACAFAPKTAVTVAWQ